MSGVAAIMDELAATLTSALGSDVEQVVGRMNFDPTPTSIDIYPADPFRDTESSGFGDTSGKLLFTVRARVTTADNEAGQDVLLALMDDESALCVAAALMEDQTLNGLAASVDVDGPSGYTVFVDSGSAGSLVGCTWNVTVLNATT